MLFTMMLALAGVAALGICFLAGGFESLAWLWMLPVGFIGGFLLAFLLAFLFIFILCSRVDTSVPQEHDDPFFRKVTYLYAEAIIPFLRMKVHTRGLEKTPKEGRFLLVCNHLGILDPVVLLGAFPKAQLAFVSKKENSHMFIIGNLMHKIMCQNIDRENDREALKTILKCIQLLKTDEVSVGVFPEGYTSHDGKVHHFRSGVFKIATKAQVPIVVCGLQNTEKVFHNRKRLKATRIPLRVAGVIQPDTYQGRTAVDISQEAYERMLSVLPESFRVAEEE